MRIRTVALGTLCGLTLIGVTTPAAQTDSSSVNPYELGPKSSFQTGCFGPCLCPILSRSLKGTFGLRHVGFDGLFDHYIVSDVRWTLTESNSTETIRGSGTFTIGGEFASQEQLSLDLAVGDGPPQHFDSGLIVGGGEFPRIDIDVSLHGNSACVDTVIHVDASDPVVTSVDADPGGRRISWAQAAPNPFGRLTEVRLNLDRPARVEVTIYDVLGRPVRHLAREAWLPSGHHALSWDGRRDQGTECAAGVYFVHATAGGERALRRIVKVE